MKTLTARFENPDQIHRFIKQYAIEKEENILIQIFTCVNKKNFIKELLTLLTKLIPQASIIGSTTSGEISNEGALTDSTVVSFSIFRDTKIKTSIEEYDTSSFTTGEKIITNFKDNEHLKLIISFTDGLHMNGEEFLEGIYSKNPKITVAGGMAGDYSRFEESFVFNEKKITSNGAVAAALYNKELNIFTEYNFNWESIGKKHIVTKSDKNRVYSIGDMTALEFYQYYLGENIEKFLPSIGIEFPLVIKKDDHNIARAAIKKHDDGSLSFAGNVPQGSVVQFGHGDVQMIINKSLENVKSILNHPIESIFIYSCMARRALLKDDINLEILPLREISSISGFFTNGEFFQNRYGSSFLNQTMTILAISENDEKIDNVTPNIFSHKLPHQDDAALHRTQALSNLIEQTTQELEDFNALLELRVKEEIEKNEQKDALLNMLKNQSQLGEMMEMIIHQWRQPLSAITTSISSIEIYNESNMLTDDILDNSLGHIRECACHLSTTIDDFRSLFQGEILYETMQSKTAIDKSLAIIKSSLIKNKITLVKNHEQSASITISLGLIMQVLLNIIKNAVDILIEKNIKDPVIEIITRIENDKLVIDIKDNGGGIPEDILPKVFDKRFTTKDSKIGTGIGLDMSRTIIETKFNGKIYAHNQSPWAIFSIELPIVK